jgi:ADP-ribosylation factor GTPase-activating protein 1
MNIDNTSSKASPKLGIFFCLACSGIHRSLGVHISFVRSVTMDAFKTAEVRRMELGGNEPWVNFFNEHNSNTLVGRDFESCTIAERYDSEAGEEWKERLTAKVEGVEYVPGAPKPKAKPAPVTNNAASSLSSSGRNTPLSNTRSSAAPQRTVSPSQKAQNEAYFSRMGEANAGRPADLPPNQGGKYAGFGSSPMPQSSTSSGGIPSTDEFQKDPLAALTKGFGWLSSTVTKQAATVNSQYIQPGMKSIADGEFAAQARATALQLGTTVQQGTKGLGDQFNKFVDPDAHNGPGGRAAPVDPGKRDFWDSFGADPAGPPKEKKDFWDDFAAAGEAAGQQQKPKPTSIGTSAMKPASTTPTTGGASASGAKEDSGWSDW